MRSTRRILAPLAALAIVVALAGVIFALHGASGSRAAGVTATTPPDAVHVVVTHYQSYSTVADASNANCSTGSSCYTTSMTPSTSTVYDHTFTDAATAQRLQSDLNAPSVAGAALPDTSTRCTYDVATWDFAFTSGGQTVEHVVMRAACDTFDIRTGFAPDLTLGADRPITSGIKDIISLIPGGVPSVSSGLSKLP